MSISRDLEMTRQVENILSFIERPRIQPDSRLNLKRKPWGQLHMPYWLHFRSAEYRNPDNVQAHIGEGEVQRMKRITKSADGTPQEELFGDFSFVPMLAGTNAA